MQAKRIPFVATFLACIGPTFGRVAFVPRVPLHVAETVGTANCTELFYTQPLDHFAFSTAHLNQYAQRYFTYDRYWQPGGPIFFYTGNEANVELYVNATGLMWENAESFGAYIVFAEHRFYGKSLPNTSDYAYLSSEQALADFATLIQHLKATLKAENCPVIAFGGSYGGKLSAWMRMKYPASVAGSIAASAPLLAFLGEDPMWDSGSYYRIITRTAAHYSPYCASNVRTAIAQLSAVGADLEGRQMLQESFRLCKPLSSLYEVEMLKYFIRDAFDEIAMGNYPWPSTYIAGSVQHPMPAWPMKQACSHLATPPSNRLQKDSHTLRALFSSVEAAVSTLYNVSGSVQCNDLPTYPRSQNPDEPMDGIWDWQWCTEMMPDSFWFSTTGEKDMFWPNPYNQTLVDTHCQAKWGITPRQTWIAAEYGGRKLTEGHTNIFFSSGAFDGWASGGVALNVSVGNKQFITSYLIDSGGHHLDLMFSHPDDPESVKQARKLELKHIQQWILEYPQIAAAKSWGDEL